jgi:uncharacterized protein (DUF433 family)
MELTLEPTTHVPLRTDASGVIRIGRTRIPLETVLHHWQQGASPEEIVEALPALRLDDVYAVVTYILRHQEAVQEYMQQSQLEEQSAMTHLRTTARTEFRTRILARAKAKGLH